MSAATLTIIRGAHRSRFTAIANDLLQNKLGLSCEARAILFDLLSRPPDWQVSIDYLAKTHKIGRDRVYRALGDLRETGHASLETLRDPETGRLAGKRWIINEEPDRLPEIQEMGGDPATDFLKSPKIGETRKSEIQDAYKRKIDKQTNNSPTKAATSSAVAREGGEGLRDDGEAPSAPAQPGAWERFKAAWPWQPGAESVTGARRAFEQLTEANQELCAKGAEAFQAPAGRRVSAWAFISEGHWAWPQPNSAKGQGRALKAPGSSARAYQRPNGNWWLAPDSPQLQRWNEFERATSADRKAKSGCVRPTEWPPNHASSGTPREMVPMPEIRAGVSTV